MILKCTSKLSSLAGSAATHILDEGDWVQLPNFENGKGR